MDQPALGELPELTAKHRNAAQVPFAREAPRLRPGARAGQVADRLELDRGHAVEAAQGAGHAGVRLCAGSRTRRDRRLTPLLVRVVAAHPALLAGALLGSEAQRREREPLHPRAMAALGREPSLSGGVRDRARLLEVACERLQRRVRLQVDAESRRVEAGAARLRNQRLGAVELAPMAHEALAQDTQVAL